MPVQPLWKILLFFFFFEQKSKMAAIAIHIFILVSQSPPCRIKRQEYYPETNRECGALPGGWLPRLVCDPWQTAQSLEVIIQ